MKPSGVAVVGDFWMAGAVVALGRGLCLWKPLRIEKVFKRPYRS